jgi:hypothetical protein
MSWSSYANTLTGATGGFENLGASISLSADGSVMAVGSMTGLGKVQTYTYNNSTSVWSPKGSTLIGEGAGDQFGIFVKLSDDGNTLLVGSWNQGGGATRLYVYQFIEGSWTQYGNTIDNAGGPNSYGFNSDQNFGFVNLSGNGLRIAIGSPGFSRVRVYEINQDIQLWYPVENAIIAPSIGSTVSLNYDGTTLVTSDNSVVYVYTQGPSSWVLEQSINPLPSSIGFGSKVAISSDGTRLIADGYSSTLLSYVAAYKKVGSTFQHIGYGNYTQGSFGNNLSISANGASFIASSQDTGDVLIFDIRSDSVVQLGDKILSTPYGNRSTGLAIAATASDYMVVIGNVMTNNSDGSATGYKFIPSAPLPPTINMVERIPGQAVLNFTPPTNDGGRAISTYRIYAYRAATPDTMETNTSGATITSSPGTIYNLANGVEYVFKISAINSIGESELSASMGSAPVDPPSGLTTAPLAPTIDSASAVNGTIIVNFTSNGDGGDPITDYYVTTYQTSQGLPDAFVKTDSTTSSPYTVTGLTTGSTYKITVSAMNGYGMSDPSLPSQEVNLVAGSLADPYVTTVNGFRYKLPTINAPIRFYQGKVDGKTLTINAQLRTMENSEIIAENLRSYLNMKSTMTPKAARIFELSMTKPETLCYFEKFYISHNGVELVLNVWDQKFKVESYTGGRFKSMIVNGKELAGAASDIYKDYMCETIKLDVGSAAIFVSVYKSVMLKNGIFIKGVDAKGSNGVLMNVLSAKDMCLDALDSHVPVVTRDANFTIQKEAFMDKDGYREKKICVPY